MGDIERALAWAGCGARRRHRTRISAPDLVENGELAVAEKNRPGWKRDLRDGRKVMRLEYSSARESAAPGCYHRDRRLQYGPSDRPGTIAAFAIWSIVSVPIFRHGSPNLKRPRRFTSQRLGRFFARCYFRFGSAIASVGCGFPLISSADNRPSMFLITSISAARASAVSGGSSA